MDHQSESTPAQPVDLSDEQRLRLVDAIYDAGRKVTVGDVVQRTGLSAGAVAVSLRDLAFQCKAHILVDSSGNVAYRFKYGFHRQIRIPLAAIMRFLWQLPGSIYTALMRIAFGIMLTLLSGVFILPLVLFAIAKSVFDFVNLRDQPDERYGILDLKNWPRLLGGALRTEIKHAGKVVPSNIFLDCYSFVFGDGDPNPDLEERKWQKLAKLIQRNNGVLICEQLAPYLGRSPQEDDMIPVMVRFDGTPEVTESGELVYLFPHASIHFAKDVEKNESQLTDDVDYLQERNWSLTGISIASKTWIGFLALANALGIFMLLVCACYHSVAYKVMVMPIVLFLEQHLLWLWRAMIAIFHLVGFWGTIGGTLFLIVLVPCLFLLSWFFVVYPPARFLLNQIRNIPIWLRNRQRRSLALALSAPAEKLTLKLKKAQDHAPVKIQINEDHPLFDSSKDSLEQQFSL